MLRVATQLKGALALRYEDEDFKINVIPKYSITLKLHFDTLASWRLANLPRGSASAVPPSFSLGHPNVTPPRMGSAARSDDGTPKRRHSEVDQSSKVSPPLSKVNVGPIQSLGDDPPPTSGPLTKTNIGRLTQCSNNTRSRSPSIKSTSESGDWESICGSVAPIRKSTRTITFGAVPTSKYPVKRKPIKRRMSSAIPESVRSDLNDLSTDNRNLRKEVIGIRTLLEKITASALKETPEVHKSTWKAEGHLVSAPITDDNTESAGRLKTQDSESLPQLALVEDPLRMSYHASNNEVGRSCTAGLDLSRTTCGDAPSTSPTPLEDRNGGWSVR